MEYKIGTDIIEVSRIKNAMENDKFVLRVFTDREIEYCENKKEAKYQSYSARFAGKEAVFKAISPLLDDKYKIDWKNVEILNDENGRPYVNIIGIDFPNNINIDVSLSHLKEYATATAIVYYNN